MAALDKTLAAITVGAISTVFYVGVSVGQGSEHDVSEAPLNWSCDNGYVALTYDDGPTEHTEALMDALDAADMTATFFLTGTSVQDNPEVVEDMVKRGYQIGNHTTTHPHLTKTGVNVRQQITDTQLLIVDAAGTRSTLFRPPYGETSAEVREIAESRGLTEVIWTLDTFDWKGKTAEQIAGIVSAAGDGDIILMHDDSPVDVAAVPMVAKALSEAGLCTGRIVESEEVKEAWEGLTFTASVEGKP